MERTTATVESLAPDVASLAAARKLARGASWSELGQDEQAVWGQYQGSRATPYQVHVLGSVATCSCPSRKVPCKHALALLLLAADGGVPAGERPAWVSESRAPRRARGEPVRDPEAAARRAAEREERVAAGVEDLRLWLRDAVRGGLAAGRLRSWEEWDAFAARLVDAQAPGAASRLRSLGGVAAGRPDGWPERLLSGLGSLHLLCEAYARADGPVRDDVRALLGFNASRDDVLAGPRVRDRWIVLARTVLEQERLRVQRTWLWGEDGGRPALLLDFAPPFAPLEPRPPAGHCFDAALAFYPGATPLRALVADEIGALEEAPGRFGTGGVQDALAATATAVAANPWLDEWPVALESATPDGPTPWTLNAPDGALPLGGQDAARWRLLALSAGRPVSVFGLWNGQSLTPLAAADGERTVAL